MIRVIDVEALGIPTLSLPEGSGESTSCRSHCQAFRPAPQADGNLRVDPDVHLPSVGLDVEIASFYNAVSTQNGPFGYGRTLSQNLTAQASGSPALVTITRGDGSLVSYLSNGSGTYVPQTPGLLNTLVEDSVDSLWKETTPDGITTAYPLNTTGAITTATYIQDPVGNTHSLSYASGLLQTLEDPGGRLVSFGYSGGLLQTIEDWAGRVTSFAYNTTLATPRNLLTTVTGPTGCQTQYQYATFTLSTFTASAGYDWMLCGIVDPNGYGTSYTYDPMRRAVTRAVAGVGMTSFLQMSSGVLVIDALGHWTTQTFDSHFGLLSVTPMTGGTVSFTRNANEQETSRQDGLGHVTTTLYDSIGNVNGTINALGYRTTLTHDSYNNLTSVQTADGAIWTSIWGYTGSSFDTTGAKRRLQVSVDPLGNITSYGYTGQGLLLSVQNPLGFLTTNGYDQFGNKITVQEPLGHVTTRVFDLAGNVLATINPLGYAWSTTYDEQNRPLTQVDPLGNTTTAAYDSLGNKVVSIDPLGNRTSWSYNVFDKPVARTDALGNVWTSVYDPLGRVVANIDPLGHQSTQVWDAASRLVASVDPLGHTSTTVFNAANQAIASVNPLGYRTSSVYDNLNRVVATIDALGNQSTIIFDAVGREVASINALGLATTAVYDLAGRTIASVDALGNRSTANYDSTSRVVSSVDPIGRINTMIFDNANRLIVQVDALGYLSTTNYDVASRTISSVDALGRFTTSVFDAANRKIASVDALGFHWTTNYDGASRSISSADPLGRMRTMVYDALSRTIASVDALSYHSTFNYDVANRNVSLQTALGIITTNIFDNASHRIAEMSPLGSLTSLVLDAASQKIAIIDALGYRQTSLFDPVGRVQSSVNPLGYITTRLFDAVSLEIATVDPLGYRTSYGFDALGRQIAIQDARGFLTSVIFDAASQQIAVVDANSHVVTSVYDLRGSVLATQDALGALISSVYDAVGNIMERIDARGFVTSYTLDALNRTVGQLYPNGNRVTNTFDAAGQQITQQDLTGIRTLVWDLNGRRLSVAYPTTKTLTYSLDPVGHRILLMDSDGGLTTYSWDAQNRLVGISNPFAELTTIVYDALNRELHKTLGNGMSVSHSYDPAGREIVLGNFGSSGIALAVFSSTYDPANNRLTVLEVDGTHVTCSYDPSYLFPSYQLINEQRSGVNAYNTTYQYDPVGNRLVKQDSGALTTSTYNAANELVLLTPPSGPPTTSSYDANGNLVLENTGGALTSYSWDFENRLTVYTAPTGMETYTYSTDGMRQQKVNSQGTTNYVWDDVNVLLETNASLVTQAHYTDYPGDWGALASERRSGASSFYGFDSQNSTRILVSISGLVTDNYSYKAFGEELASGSGTTNPYRYLGAYGYYRDFATRQYVRARHLEMVNGRWISRDPYFASIRDHRYVYANENPLIIIDPSGLVCVFPYGSGFYGHSEGASCCCGALRATWLFLLDNPATNPGTGLGGYMVQYNTWTGEIHGSTPPAQDCQTTEPPSQCLKFTELIRVGAGQGYGTDSCTFPSEHYSWTDGIKDTGEIKYFTRETLKNIYHAEPPALPGWVLIEKCAGVNWILLGEAPMWFETMPSEDGNPGRIGHRSCSAKWCCDCPGSQKNTSDTTASPQMVAKKSCP